MLSSWSNQFWKDFSFLSFPERMTTVIETRTIFFDFIKFTPFEFPYLLQLLPIYVKKSRLHRTNVNKSLTLSTSSWFGASHQKKEPCNDATPKTRNGNCLILVCYYSPITLGSV